MEDVGLNYTISLNTISIRSKSFIVFKLEFLFNLVTLKTLVELLSKSDDFL